MATAESTGGLGGLFGDDVYSSSDLNRRCGEVLDRARRGPVTISRNREQFALLRREQAAELVKATLQLGPLLELIDGVTCIEEKREPPASVAWLQAFDISDLRTMQREVLVAASSALNQTKDWDAVGAIIHEWRESALADPALGEAMAAPAEDMTLPRPEGPDPSEQQSD